EGHGSADAQNPARLGVQPSHRELRSFRFFHDAGAMLVEDRSGFGDAQRARGPIEQPRTDRLLELGDALAHHRFRQAEPPRGAGEALLLHHAGEDRHTLEILHLFRSGRSFLATVLFESGNGSNLSRNASPASHRLASATAPPEASTCASWILR